MVEADDGLFVYDRVRLLSIDLERGVIGQRSPNLLTRSTTLGVNVGRDGVLYSLTPEGSVAFDADLSVRWQDALASEPKKLLTQRLGEDHVFVFEQYQGAASPPGLRLSALQRKTGRLVGQAMLNDLGAAGSLGVVQVMRDHLLVADRGGIALIPGDPTPGR